MNPKNKRSEAELIACLASRNQQAFSDFYDHYAPYLYGIIIRSVNDEEVANDLLQDSFIKIWKYAGNYDPAKGRLLVWLVQIAKRVIWHYQHIASPKQIGTQPLEQDFLNSYSPPINENGLDLPALVGYLNPSQAKTIELVYFEELTHKEAATRLNIPIGTLNARVCRALQKLRELIRREPVPIHS